MITRVEVRHFKCFDDQTFDLAEVIVLAGPNNAGKSTLLQAVATWRLGLDRWVAQRRTSRAEKRTGVAITRKDFTSVPLREMNLLWEDRKVSGGGRRAGTPRMIEITLHGHNKEGKWNCGLEFQYANPELVYVRPLDAKRLSSEDLRSFPPSSAEELEVVHVPALSGIEHDEPRRDPGMQDLLIGQGRPGDILRNLLLEVSEQENVWTKLQGNMEELFHVTLHKPSYTAAQPFIISEYEDPQHDRPLDLSNAGSGMLQVLLLLTFFYARSATVLLLDEPDAHQHVILQKEVYDLVRRVAYEKGSQLVIATHSEVVLDATEPERVLAFVGDQPRNLAHQVERDQLREALKRITTTDLILGREVGGVLYVEGDSDERILSAWANVLEHPAQRFLNRPYVHWLSGRSLKEARSHFFALRAAFPEISGVCLLDGDNLEEPGEETTKLGLKVLRWRRYEIENYLLVPDSIKRYLEFEPLFEQLVDEEFGKQVPAGADLFGDHVALVRVKASEEFLVPLFARLNRPTPKKDLYLVASRMRPEEIHPEVKEKLDRISEFLVRA